MDVKKLSTKVVSFTANSTVLPCLEGTLFFDNTKVVILEDVPNDTNGRVRGLITSISVTKSDNIGFVLNFYFFPHTNSLGNIGDVLLNSSDFRLFTSMTSVVFCDMIKLQRTTVLTNLNIPFIATNGILGVACVTKKPITDPVSFDIKLNLLIDNVKN